MRETAAKLLPLGPDDMYRKEPSDKVRYFKRDEEVSGSQGEQADALV